MSTLTATADKTVFNKKTKFRAKDPASAATHFIGFIWAILMTPVMLIHSVLSGADTIGLVSIAVFMVGMILLYGASSSYHAFDVNEKVNTYLKKMDHSMICVLIAGTYTPVCVISLPASTGMKMLIGVWAFAAMGILFKMFWVNCPKWVSSVIYIAMGWLCVGAIPVIYASLSFTSFMWMLAGGIIYTVGGVIYAMKFEKLNNRFPGFGNHEIFHLFVMAGSLCHFISIWNMIG